MSFLHKLQIKYFFTVVMELLQEKLAEYLLGLIKSNLAIVSTGGDQFLVMVNSDAFNETLRLINYYWRA